MTAPALAPPARPRRVRHHVNPLKEGFLGTAPEALSLPARPLEIELGCADARFLFERARERPEACYVGLEIRRALVDLVNERARREGLSPADLRAVFANITYDLPVLFAGRRAERIFVNFPDPWFKRAQHKRRLMQKALGLTLRDLLAPGGELFFQSDIFDLALDAMAVLEETAGLANHHGEWSFARASPYQARSLREVRVLEKGGPVWRMLYRRC